MPKKIDVTEEAHAAAKAHCKERNVRVIEWVSKLIIREVDPAREGHDRVIKKPVLPVARGFQPTSHPAWEKPPFWAK